MSAATPHRRAREPASDGGIGVIYWIIGGVVVVLVRHRPDHLQRREEGRGGAAEGRRS